MLTFLPILPKSYFTFSKWWIYIDNGDIFCAIFGHLAYTNVRIDLSKGLNGMNRVPFKKSNGIRRRKMYVAEVIRIWFARPYVCMQKSHAQFSVLTWSVIGESYKRGSYWAEVLIVYARSLTITIDWLNVIIIYSFELLHLL